jgi:hypothetical protein
MKRIVKRLEIKEGVHLQGLGVLSSVLPMSLKDIPMSMYYDTAYPGVILIEAKGDTHFISLATVKSGTFGDLIK